MTHVQLSNHREFGNGKAKTICVTAVLTALGVPINSFHYTWNGKRNCWDSVLRRHGYAVRSRRSKLPKRCSVGQARTRIANLDDPAGTLYIIKVEGHILLLDSDGKTVVDTAPRKRDRRQVIELKAIFRNI
jgi:hypothetical protein